jgi:ankyrin repeat protein
MLNDAVNQFSALCDAIARHEDEMVITLLQRLPSLVTAVDDMGYHAIDVAITVGNEAAVNALITRGAQLGGFVDGVPRITYAIRCGNARIVKLLISSGADISALDVHDHHSPLAWAVINNRLDIVSMLLEAGAHVDPPDASDPTSWSPLHWAAFTGNSDIVRTLLAVGADRGARGGQ